MSEQERIQEKTSKLVVGSTFLILAGAMLLLSFISSCSTSYTSCAAYASIECENCDEID